MIASPREFEDRHLDVTIATDASAADELSRDHTRLEQLILGHLDEEKAQDVLFIDVLGRSALADALIVASGRSRRHVGAVAEHLLRTLKGHGFGKARVEGLAHCDWVLIDAGDVIVHLFRPEVRAYYNLEKIWSVSPPDRTIHP
jgi:ribosome-associated protein